MKFETSIEQFEFWKKVVRDFAFPANTKYSKGESERGDNW